ncbi:hypothetical protein AB0J08_41300, partial [Kitasatospora sp. NPDC050463]
RTALSFNQVAATTWKCRSFTSLDSMAPRGAPTRYDKTPGSYLAGLHLRGAMIWIKDLTKTAP